MKKLLAISIVVALTASGCYSGGSNKDLCLANNQGKERTVAYWQPYPGGNKDPDNQGQCIISVGSRG